MLNMYKYHHTETLFTFTISVVHVQVQAYFSRIYVIYFSFLSSFSLGLNVQSHEYRPNCSFAYFLEYVPIFLDDKLDEERKTLSSSKNPASKACLAFASFFANFSLDLLIKVLLIKKNYYEYIPISIYLSKVNNKNSRTICEICSKLKMKTPEQHH